MFVFVSTTLCYDELLADEPDTDKLERLLMFVIITDKPRGIQR